MLAQNRESGGNHESFMGCQPRTSSSCLISVVAVFIIFKLRFPRFSILLFIFLYFLKELLMPGRFQPWGNAVLLELEEFSKWHLFNRNKRKDVVSLTCIHHFVELGGQSVVNLSPRTTPSLYFREWVVSGRHISGTKVSSESC